MPKFGQLIEMGSSSSECTKPFGKSPRLEQPQRIRILRDFKPPMLVGRLFNPTQDIRLSEISILEFCEEFRTMESHVPKVGWGEVDKIQPIISALEECKLPAFSADLFCLASGSNSVEEIENNIVKFKNCSVKYLTEESKMMGLGFLLKTTPNGDGDVEVLEDINTTYFMAGDVSDIKGVSDLSGRHSVVGSQVNWEADRLSLLVDKCNMVQNMKDQKMFYYY
ncbi:hypothetical protein FNV43_RR01923 [Rhamnella rubrinervis]|uniref:Uncharacterized protein n=1 Tax=Rhamnella rubrinervis TaxID=2594499 RepID=A0A8K0MSH4_9ROSA|nr:hypothetical protein FNV43_RR01923 [Rhamnella rubrinervis]